MLDSTGVNVRQIHVRLHTSRLPNTHQCVQATLLALLSFATDQYCSVRTVTSSLLTYTHIAAGCLADAKSRNAAIRSTILGGHLEAQMLSDCLSPFHRNFHHDEGFIVH